MKIPALYSQIKYFLEEKKVPDCHERIFTLKVPIKKNTDFYLGYTDPSNKFCIVKLEKGQEYIPKSNSLLLNVPSFLPKRPFLLRKLWLYWQYIPSFF